MGYVNERQGLILELLRNQGSVTIHDLQSQLGIPAATAYRDAKILIESGYATRQHGRLMLREEPEQSAGFGVCIMCNQRVDQRLAFSLQLTGGQQASACCSHCGLMFLRNNPHVKSALAADYLYGRMVNVRQAKFLVGSQIKLCCDPSILCFSNQDDAARFQAGFGGRVLDYEQASQEVGRQMMLRHEHRE